jgi:hypothetical protein
MQRLQSAKTSLYSKHFSTNNHANSLLINHLQNKLYIMKYYLTDFYRYHVGRKTIKQICFSTRTQDGFRFTYTKPEFIKIQQAAFNEIKEMCLEAQKENIYHITHWDTEDSSRIRIIHPKNMIMDVFTSEGLVESSFLLFEKLMAGELTEEIEQFGQLFSQLGKLISISCLQN